MGSSTRLGKRGVPSQRGGNSDLRRRIITACSCSRLTLSPLAKRWLSSSSKSEVKLSKEPLWGVAGHLAAPLPLQGGRKDNQYLGGRMTYNRLLEDKARLNGLAQADIISNQQVGTRHLDGPHDRVKLVIFHLNAAAKGGLQGLD